MIHEQEVVHIGKLGKPHGVKGEITFTFTTDVWDRVDADYLVLMVDGILVPFFLEEYRFRGEHSALLKFLDIDSIEDVQEYAGAEVYFPLSLVPDDEDVDYTWAYFVGFRVHDAGAGELGEIVAVDESTMNVLFEVRTTRGNILVPAAEDFIREIDHENRIVRMDLPKGLLEI